MMRMMMRDVRQILGPREVHHFSCQFDYSWGNETRLKLGVLDLRVFAEGIRSNVKFWNFKLSDGEVRRSSSKRRRKVHQALGVSATTTETTDSKSNRFKDEKGSKRLYFQGSQAHIIILHDHSILPSILSSFVMTFCYWILAFCTQLFSSRNDPSNKGHFIINRNSYEWSSSIVVHVESRLANTARALKADCNNFFYWFVDLQPLRYSTLFLTGNPDWMVWYMKGKRNHFLSDQNQFV